MSTNHLIKNTIIVADSKNLEDKKVVLYGIVTELILSDKFKKNSELSNFTHDFFGVQFKDYVFKSRTLVLARCLRLIEKYDLDETNDLVENLLLIFNIKPPKNKSNSNNLEVLLSWKKVINHE